MSLPATLVTAQVAGSAPKKDASSLACEGARPRRARRALVSAAAVTLQHSPSSL
jgi:hypothetical protein